MTGEFELPPPCEQYERDPDNGDGDYCICGWTEAEHPTVVVARLLDPDGADYADMVRRVAAGERTAAALGDTAALQVVRRRPPPIDNEIVTEPLTIDNARYLARILRARAVYEYVNGDLMLWLEGQGQRGVWRLNVGDRLLVWQGTPIRSGDFDDSWEHVDPDEVGA